MVRIKAHFDGQVFVPEEPVSLDANEQVKLIVVRAPQISPKEAKDDEFHDPKYPLRGLIKLIESLPRMESDLPPDASKEVDHYLYGTPKHGI